MPRNDWGQLLSLQLCSPHKVWQLMAQHSESPRNRFHLKGNTNPFRVICLFPLWCFLHTALKVIPLTNKGLHSPVFKDLCCLSPISPSVKLCLPNMHPMPYTFWSIFQLPCIPSCLATYLLTTGRGAFLLTPCSSHIWETHIYLSNKISCNRADPE